MKSPPVSPIFPASSIRLDASFIEELSHPKDHTIVGSTEAFRSGEVQLERFKDRLDDPSKQWKISKSDYDERPRWKDYMKAYEDALSQCSAAHAPWYVIPADHKWFRDLAASQILADTFEAMKIAAPKPSVDLAEIRKLYDGERRRMKQS